MRNSFYFKHFTVFILLCSSLCLNAQGFIMEHTQGVPSDLTSKTNFDRQNYTNLLNENGNNVYVSNPSIGSLSTPTNKENDVNNVIINVNLVFGQNETVAPWIVMVYNESGFFQSVMFPEDNTVTFNVPAGNYEVFADFSVPGTVSHIVIEELVEVSDNTIVELVATDADNYVTINTYDENGELLEPGKMDAETENPSLIVFTRIIRFIESNNIAAINIYKMGMELEDEPAWNFYMNDVSDRYGISQTFLGAQYGKDNYYTKYNSMLGISESRNFENDPNDWTLHVEKFQPSAVNQSDIYTSYSTVMTYNNKIILGNEDSSSAFTLNPEEGFRAYVNNPNDDDPTGFLVYPTIVDHRAIADPTWIEESFPIRGNALFTNENGEVEYGSGNINDSFYFLGFRNYFDGTWFSALPTNPKFTFLAENSPNIKMGDNTPIAVTMSKVVPNEMNIIDAQYRGNYGEIRESDFFLTQVQAKHQNSVIFSGSYIDFLWQYGKFSNGLPTNGEIELLLTNSNIEIDGMAGKNITKINYNASQADLPPSIQAIQFRTSADEVTNRFQSAADGTLRFAAGDFNLEFNEFGNSYYTYNEGNNVQLFYSPYNQNNWVGIETTKYPELILMPAFGDYYEASLANVFVGAENSWFDVKIVCTDVAGNKQEQTISPAFKIAESNLSVEEINTSGFTVYPNPFTNELNMQLPENIKGNYNFKVTDLSGKTIYTQDRNADAAKSFIWDGSSFTKGTYILSIESNGKTIAKKVMKK